jgi:NADH dehydrogenase
MDEKIVAIAGGSGFIGRAIVRRLSAMPSMRLRVLTRNPDSARKSLDARNAEYVRAEVTDPATLAPALAGADAVVNTVQFEGYPIEDSSRGLTFERIDFGGTVALLAAAKAAGTNEFIYVRGAAADETSAHPGFRAKGRAERAVRESGLAYTIFRPSLVYGPDDKVVSNFARLLKLAPVFGVPGTGRQKLQPVLVDDLAACVALALTGRGRNGTYDVGGPELMSFDEFVKLLMEVTGRRRFIIHIPERVMRAIGAVAERLPKPLLSRDAVTFVTADNACNIAPLIEEFGIRLTPAREGLAYLGPKR